MYVYMYYIINRIFMILFIGMKKTHKILTVFLIAVFVYQRNVWHVSYSITYKTSLRIDIFVMRGTLIMLFILNIQNMSSSRSKQIQRK